MPSTSISHHQLAGFLDSLLNASTPSNSTAIDGHLGLIDQEITRVQTRIQASIKSDWPTFQHQWLTGASLYHRSLHLETQLDQLQSKLDHPRDGLIPNLLSALKDRQKIATQRSQSLQKLKVINSLSAAYQALLTLSQLVYSNNLVTAVAKLPETQSTLKPLYSSQLASSLVKRAVYRIQELEEDLKQRLIDDVRSCFIFQDGGTEDAMFQFHSAVNARTSPQQTNSSIPWSSAVDALETLIGQDAVAGQLKKLVTLLVDKIFTPLVESCSNSGSNLILVQLPNSGQSSRVIGFKQQVGASRVDFYDSLRLLLSMLQEILLTSKSLQDKFSQLLIPSLEAKLLSQVLDAGLPISTRDDPRLSQLSGLLSETRLFANWLQDHGWLAHSKENKLLTWCDQVHDRFLHQVATRVLELARREMVTTQWESTIVAWEVAPEIEPPSLSSRKENAQRAQPHSVSHPSSSEKHFSPTTQQVPQSQMQPAGFKSLFRFVSSTSHQVLPSDPTSSILHSRNPESSISSKPKNFESLFDFDPAEPQVGTDASEPYNPFQSSSPQQQASSKILDRLSQPSQPSSPTSTRKLSSSHLSPIQPISTTEVGNKAEEDIDWDMGAESEDPEPFPPTNSTGSGKLRQVAVLEEEIEEDAWGLDGSNEEFPTTTATDIFVQSASSGTTHENASSKAQVSADPSPSACVQAANYLPEEDEPDPDAWGFEEEEEEEKEEMDEPPTLTDDDHDEVLRLRGGVGSSPATSVVQDEDGWGWNEDVTVDQSLANDNHDPASGKEKDAINLTRSTHQSTIHTEQLTISTLAQKVLDMVEQVVNDAIQTESPEFPSDPLRQSGVGLIKLGFDIIDLFRIIMFNCHYKLLDSVPSLSVQFTNDCDWLSYQLGLIPTLQNRHPDDLRMASLKLKALATKVRKNQIANQKAALMECLNEAEGFVQTSREDRFSVCQRACKQVSHTLETLAQVWKPVMLRKEYLQSMGELVETVLSRILNEIEEQTDIEENESNSLNRLCKSLHPLSNLFKTSSQPGPNSSSPNDNDDDIYYRYVPSWFKFCFLSELLEASMADIMWMYQEGHLNEFSKQEIVKLIKALFADSQLRAKNIDLILQ